MASQDQKISPLEIEAFFHLIEIHTGISLDLEKEYLLASRLNEIAKKDGFTSYVGLVRKLIQIEVGPLHWKCFEAMATHETMFFRDKYPFEVIKDIILPNLIKVNKNYKKINIWCAACSTGQEPYSLAILLRENFPELKDWAIRIHATDLSEKAILQARSGIYTESEIKRGLTADLINKYFSKAEKGNYKINSDLQNAIQFEQMNLVKPWQINPKADLILMRNILIYFRQEAKLQLLKKIKEQMSDPLSYLMLGSSESIIFDKFFKLHSLKHISYYSKESH